MPLRNSTTNLQVRLLSGVNRDASKQMTDNVNHMNEMMRFSPWTNNAVKTVRRKGN
jgi:hypothetical protein